MIERIQVIHHWDVYSLREWRFGFFPYSSYGFAPAYGWQFGPFAFEEEHNDRSWPVAVDKAARALAAQKLNLKDPELVKEPELMIYDNYSSQLRWCAVISAPGEKQLEVYFDSSGKLLRVRKRPDFGKVIKNIPVRSCIPRRTRGLFRW